jgi:hypothetical protein
MKLSGSIIAAGFPFSTLPTIELKLANGPVGILDVIELSLKQLIGDYPESP